MMPAAADLPRATSHRLVVRARPARQPHVPQLSHRLARGPKYRSLGCPSQPKDPATVQRRWRA
eukprot:scaffold1439_cov404-Prasinococcus_capsulatus_cf.AAC.49